VRFSRGGGLLVGVVVDSALRQRLLELLNLGHSEGSAQCQNPRFC